MARKKTSFSIPSFVMEDPRFVKLSGLALALTGIFLFVAFLSYLFTWKVDQSYATLPLGSLLGDPTIIVDNALGKLGAKISHFFFYDFAGLASFVVAIAFLVLGGRLLSARIKISVAKVFFATIFGLLFLSLLFSFIFGYFDFPFGGGLGNYLNATCQSNLGFAGTGILLIFAVLGLLVYAYNFNTENLVPNSPNFKSPFPIKAKTNGKKTGFNWSSLWPFGGKEASIIKNEIENTKTAKGAKAKTKTPKKEQAEISETDEYYEDENGYYDEDGYYYEYINEEDVDDVEEEDVAPTKTTIQKANSNDNIKSDSSNQSSINHKNVSGNSNKSDTEVSKLQLEEADAEPGAKPVKTAASVLAKSYDPHLDLGSYKMPTLELLQEYEVGNQEIIEDEINLNKNRIRDTLKNYNIDVTIPKATVGPTFTLFEIKPAAGIRISKIKTLEDDIAMSLSALGIRIIAPMPGKGTVGIEVPNEHKEIVSLRTILSSKKFSIEKEKMELPIALGTSISNGIHVADLTKMPHLLLAGATGMGKSVAINCILLSLLYSKHPSELKFVMVDPKKVELSIYEKLEKHFLAKLPDEEDPILIDTRRVIYTLNSLCIEMDNRYSLLKEAGVRSIKEYNTLFKSRKLNPELGHQFLPYIVLVVDEFADLILTAGKEIELPLTRLAQLARAVGIHLIIATQRPTVNIITGTIKANFPVRIAFRVVSKVDSKTILDVAGADRLVGRGDMLFSHNGDTVRMQGPFVDTPEVNNVLNHIHQQQGYPEPFILPEYVDEKEMNKMEGKIDIGQLDEIFMQAARLIVTEQMGSTSLLQRKMKLGYNRAGRIMDQMENLGIVGPSRGSKPRDVLVGDLVELDRIFGTAEV